MTSRAMLPGMAHKQADLLKLDEEIGNKHPTAPVSRQKFYRMTEDHDSATCEQCKSGRHSSSCPENLMDKGSSPDKHNASNGSDLWIDGLLCAYEFIPAVKNKVHVGGRFGQKSGPVRGNFTADITMGDGTKELPAVGQSTSLGPDPASSQDSKFDDGSDNSGVARKGRAGHSSQAKEPRSQWVPIGWARITELVEYVQTNSVLSEDMVDDLGSDDDSMAVADQAAPFWQVPAGPIWWCHVSAVHPNIMKWLTYAQWMHPAISSGLRDESRLISERMKHLFYEVPVRVGGGLLFELLGQSVGDPHRNEDDIPIVLRSFTSMNFLITAMHVKGDIPHGLNVIGISEVQDIVGAGGVLAPRTAHEVVALLADRLARWDDRLYRKHYFGEADEVELKFVSRRGDDDLAVMSIILNQEIRRLSTQVIRVKWSLHAREEILYELLAHLRGKNTQLLLNKVAESTRAMLREQEAVRDRLFTVQDVMQSTVRASLQDTSVRIQHNLAVIGGAGLFLSVIAGLFGINVDGIPGENTPYAFAVFSGVFFTVGALMVGLGIMYLGFRPPPTEEQLASRKKELQNLVKKFQNSAEAHENVREVGSSWSDRLGSPVEDLGNDFMLIGSW
ncbi:unnamed protein product [Calypogeia fissa]